MRKMFGVLLLMIILISITSCGSLSPNEDMIGIDGVIYNGTNTTDNSKGMVFVNNDIINAYIDYSTDNDYWYLGLEFKTVGVTIEWAKLELGEVATPYVPRLYAEELQLCKRYYQYINLNAANVQAITNKLVTVMVDYEVQMRVNPTLAKSEFNGLWVSNMTNHSGFTITGAWLTTKFSTIDLNKSNSLDYSKPIRVDGKIYLDAEL